MKHRFKKYKAIDEVFTVLEFLSMSYHNTGSSPEQKDLNYPELDLETRLPVLN